MNMSARRATTALNHSAAQPAGHDVARSRCLLACTLLLFSLWAIFSGAAPAVKAQTPDATHLQTVRAEYGIMLDSYVRPLDPATLLNAAWNGATAFLRQNGIRVTTRLPNLSSDRGEAFASFGVAWMGLAGEVGTEVSLTDVAFAADDEMANVVNDDHTGFLPPDIYTAIQQELGGADVTQIGAGVEVSRRPPHVITDIAPGGPGEQAGLKRGDAVAAVNGRSVENVSGAAFDNAIAGEAGTTFTITVRRPGAGTVEIDVVYGPYHFPIFSAKVLPDGATGYMQLRSFVNPWNMLENSQNVIQQLDAALESFENAGVTRWILDLRNNGGGTGFTNQAFAGRFLADGKTEIDTDARGHRGESLVDGHAFRVQRPLAVLINGNSASSSEVVASTLQEYNRATIVGGRSAGALGAALIFPLPDDAGIEITVAQVVSGRYGTPIDGFGVQADVEARNPTAADLVAGRDPGIDAAVAALAGQQPFTPPASTDATMSVPALRATLASYEVTAAEVPLAPEINTENYFGDYVIDSYNEWNNWEGSGRDAFASRDLAHQRGWQGAQLQFFGETPVGAAIGVQADLYATAGGAAAAMAGTDFPDLLVPVPAPIQIGEQTVAYRGQWVDSGLIQIVWRHGRLLLTVQLATVPGEETFDPLVTLARTVDAHYQAQPLAGQ